MQALNYTLTGKAKDEKLCFNRTLPSLKQLL